VEVRVLVVMRFDVPTEDADDFVALAEQALAALAQQPGYASGTLGHAVDHESAWVLVTRWQSIGSYRRALSAFDVRTSLLPLTVRAVDEPGAYEILHEQAKRASTRTRTEAYERSGPCGRRPAG
jgi:quinol monooxygenase YgiN